MPESLRDEPAPIHRPRDEQSDAERREIARRYRGRRGEELTAIARDAGIESPEAVGEFSSVPLEDFAAIPFVGAIAAGVAKLKGRRHGLPNQLYLVVDAGSVIAIARRWTQAHSKLEVRELRRWSRSEIRVERVMKRSLKTQVIFAIEGEDKPLVLYATSLRINPWSADVVSALGGNVPPLVLREDVAADQEG